MNLSRSVGGPGRLHWIERWFAGKQSITGEISGKYGTEVKGGCRQTKKPRDSYEFTRPSKCEWS